jgi:hypothetical protein
LIKKKWLPRLGYLGLFWLLIGVFLAAIFLWWNPECDGFSCLGFIMILAPFFTFGFLLLVIFILIFFAMSIRSYLLKNNYE